MAAAARDDLATVERLAAEGVDLSAWDNRGYGALHQAAAGGAASVVEFLLAAGVSPDAPDRIGWTPLTWAAWVASVAATRALLGAGADPNARFEPNFVTPLGQLMAAWHMGRDGAERAPPFRPEERVQVAALLFDSGADPNLGGDYGVAPLQTALLMRNVDLLELFVQYGGDFHAVMGAPWLSRSPGPLGDVVRRGLEAVPAGRE